MAELSFDRHFGTLF